MITNNHGSATANGVADTTTETVDYLARIADAPIPFELTEAALTHLAGPQADENPGGAVMPIHRAEWAVQAPTGHWVVNGVVDPEATEPTAYQSLDEARTHTRPLVVAAEVIGARRYTRRYWVRPVVIDGNGVHVGTWARHTGRVTR